MAAKLSSRFKSYLVASITQSLRSQNPPAWLPNTIYTVGNQVTNSRNIYAATKAGSSGPNPGPNTSSGILVDGTVNWIYIGPAFDPSAINSNLYMGLGRTQAWPNESIPPTATADETETKETLDDLICLLRLTSSNTRQGLKKNEWVTGTVYHAFTGVEDDADNPNLYVTVDQTDVFKCIDNKNGAASTVKPNARAQGYLVLADGYVWKYMGSVSNVDLVKFATTDHVPIQVAAAESGSDQAQTQENARAGELSSFISPYTALGTGTITTTSVQLVTELGTHPTTPTTGAATVLASLNAGAVDHIYVSSPGWSYPTETFAVVSDLAITQPTTQASYTVNLSSGGVSSLTQVASGAGYTNAVAVIIGDGAGATATAVIGGGGVTSVTVDTAGTGYTWARCVIVAGTRAYAAKAIMGPYAGHGKNITTELSAGTLLISIGVSSAYSPYVVNGEFRQVSLISSLRSAATSQSNALALIGPQHPQWITPTSVPAPNKYVPNTGQLLYLNNITVVTHATGQEETIKVAITF